MQPFADIDVLDLTQSIAGPVATQFCGAFGANVVKVEPPDGDAFRPILDGAMFASVNLGDKQSLALDLKTEDGQAIAQALAERADVVIESFRPGVLDQYGLDYDSVSASNEAVIYCSVTGFGQSGPRIEWPAYDPVIQAMSGLMSTIGYPDRPPVRIGASVIDYTTGITAGFLIASALLRREQSGDGSHLDVSLLDVAIAWMGYWIANYSGTGDLPERSGQGFAGLAPNEVFTAAGDEPFYLACVNDTLFNRLCRTIDREDLMDDERFADNEVRWTNRDELREELDRTFSEYERAALTELLAENGVPAGPLQTVEEVVETDPHVRARDLLTETYNVQRDERVETAQLPFAVDGDRVDLGDRPPELGEHTREVLTELDFSADEIDRLLDAGVVIDPTRSGRNHGA